jgi:hypothetical protein
MSELSKSPHHLSSSQESMILIENPPFRWQDKAFGHKTKSRDMSNHCDTPRYTNNGMTLQMARQLQENTIQETYKYGVGINADIITKQIKLKKWKICARTKQILIRYLKQSDEERQIKCSSKDVVSILDAKDEYGTIVEMDGNDICEMSSLAVYFYTLMKCYQIDQQYST